MTSTLASNARNSSSINVAAIEAAIASARDSFALSKDSASKAAAHVYLVWLDTQSQSAPEHMRKWLLGEIETRNSEIDAHNELEATQRDRAKRLKASDLKKTDALNVAPKTDADREEQAKDRANLEALGKLEDKDWAARRKVRIERRDDASKFAEIVKFVLRFDRRADASVTSRYATVLEWIAAKFENEVPNDADEIVEAIKAAGGFEDVLHAQRGTEGNKDADEASEDRRIQAEAIIHEAKIAVANAQAKATFEMNVRNAPEGIVTLLARFKDGQVEVVGELPIGADQLGSMMAMFDDDELLPTNKRSEFVNSVLELGGLVPEGEKTTKTEDDLKAGAALKAERVLTLVPDDKAGVQLVMSARYADASVIVKAAPRKERVDLGFLKAPASLAVKDRTDLYKTIRNRDIRRLVDIEPQHGGAEVQWVTVDRALDEKGRKNARRRFVFDELAAQTHKPLDVDGFKSQFKVMVALADLTRLYDNRLNMWAKNESGKKNQKLMTLTFNGRGMAYSVDGQDTMIVPITGSIAGTALLTFRPRDLHDLVAALKGQRADRFEVSGDTGGMLCVTWADELGDYAVYLPTATASGALNMKRVQPMCCDVSQSMVA